MKKIIFLILIIQSFILIGQENTNNKNIVSNNSNYSLSPFKAIDLKKKMSKHTLELYVSNIGLGKYYDEHVAKILNVDKYKLNTALEFQLERGSLRYYYPIDFRTFNWNYYEKNISQKKGVQKVKLEVTIFKTKTNPTIVIDRIKSVKN